MTEEQIDYEDVLRKLDKNTLKMVRSARDVTKRILPTASFGINLNCGGGLRRGHQHTFWGNEQSGKSLLMLQTIAINQALGVPCAYIDVEHTFDTEWAEKNGVDVDKLFYSGATSFADVTNIQADFIRGGMGLIVIDSTSNLAPNSWLDDGDLKKFEDTKQQGQHAAELGKMSGMISSINFTSAIVHISQVRLDLGAQGKGVPMKPTQGKQAEHNDVLRVRLTSSKADKEQIRGQVNGYEKIVGRKVNWLFNKNKLTGDITAGKYDLYIKGDSLGVDKNSELVYYGLENGIVDLAGSWYTIYDRRAQGAENAAKVLKENPELAEKLEAEIYAKSV